MKGSVPMNIIKRLLVDVFLPIKWAVLLGENGWIIYQTGGVPGTAGPAETF